MKASNILLILSSIIQWVLIVQPLQAQDIRYEVVKGDTISILRFPSHDKIDVEVNAVVNRNSDGIFNYDYALKSFNTSEQPVFDFTIPTKSEIQNIKYPDDWFPITSSEIPGVSWGPMDSLNMLKPGDSIDDFSFKSKNTPSILEYSARGWAPIPKVRIEPDSTENNSVSEDSKKGFTVGPGILPDEKEPIAHVDTLQSFLTRSCTELGWIENQGLCRSLEAKLENVERQLDQGNTNAASGSLDAFINEVEAQKDKQLSPEAYALLYFNGQYLLEQLNQ